MQTSTFFMQQAYALTTKLISTNCSSSRCFLLFSHICMHLLHIKHKYDQPSLPKKKHFPGTNKPHLGKWKLIFKHALGGDILVPWVNLPMHMESSEQITKSCSKDFLRSFTLVVANCSETRAGVPHVLYEKLVEITWYVYIYINIYLAILCDLLGDG